MLNFPLWGKREVKNKKAQIEGIGMEKRNLKLLYFSPEDSGIKNLNLGFSKLIISFVAAILAVILLTGVFSFVVIKFFNTYKISELRRQNEILVSQLSDMQVKIGKIQDKMRQVEKFDNDLRDLADLPRLDEDTRSVGTGGSIEFPMLVLKELPSPTSENSSNLLKDIGKLTRQIDYQLASFMDIDNKLSKDKERFSYTPSVRPVQTGRLKSKFGTRTDPFMGIPKFHYGIDISVAIGTPVKAPAAGTVIEVNNTRALRRDFGRYIWIDHGNGLKTLYGHLSKIDVKKGQKISRWEKIGEVGRSGRSTGPHLHYQVNLNGKAVNPLEYIIEW